MFANKGLHTKPLCTLIYIHPKDWLLIPLSPKRRRTPRQKFSSHCVAHLVKKSRAPLIVGSQGCPCFLMRTVAQTPAREEPTLLIEGKSRFSFKEIIKKKKNQHICKQRSLQICMAGQVIHSTTEVCRTVLWEHSRCRNGCIKITFSPENMNSSHDPSLQQEIF